MKSRQPVTIRCPAELLAKARALLADQESFNDFVVRAVEREVRRRQRLRAHDEISRIRERITADRGLLSNSTPLIRELREEIQD
ncbi:MAG: YlcI/YnfO family protein [Thermomicrobiales bacterium]